jgi:RNA polymerase sigma factor (sigma-70 family)
MQQYNTFSLIWHMPDMAQALDRHERLVHWVVRRQWLGALPYAEAAQAGRIALWQALRGYDPHRGCTFSTYAVPAIARAIWRAVAQAQPAQAFMLDPSGQTPDLEEQVEATLTQEALYRLVAGLPHPLYTVIVARYGLDGAPPRTFAAIGHLLGVTRQRAHQLHRQALLWLAHPTHSLHLRQLRDRNTVADYQRYLARMRTWMRSRRGSHERLSG